MENTNPGGLGEGLISQADSQRLTDYNPAMEGGDGSRGFAAAQDRFEEDGDATGRAAANLLAAANLTRVLESEQGKESVARFGLAAGSLIEQVVLDGTAHDVAEVRLSATTLALLCAPGTTS